MASKVSPINVVRLLNPQPPPVAEDSEALFVDRETELQRAIEQIQAALSQPMRAVLGIIGRARVGKSHFLDRLVRQIEPDFDVCIRLPLAQGTSSLQVARSLLNHTTQTLERFVIDKGLGEAEGEHVLEPLFQLISQFQPAIQGYKMEIKKSRTKQLGQLRKWATNLKLGGKSSRLLSWLVPIELSGELSGGHENTAEERESEGDETKTEIPPFNEEALCELVILAHELVREEQSRQQIAAKRIEGQEPPRLLRTLIVLDDFDLMSPQRDGGLRNVEPLLRALYALVQSDGLYVLTTAREDTYENNEKNFYDLAFLAPFADETYLLQIYDRHIARFHGGNEPFSRDFVTEMAKRCAGRVGIFLDHLHKLFKRRSGAQLKQLSFAEYMNEVWGEIQRQESRFVAAIQTAAISGGGVLGPEITEVIFRQQSIVKRVLFEDYLSEGTLTVDPLLISFLREKAANGEGGH